MKTRKQIIDVIEIFKADIEEVEKDLERLYNAKEKDFEMIDDCYGAIQNYDLKISTLEWVLDENKYI